MSNIKKFNTTRMVGPMSGNIKFYENKTREEIKEDLLKRRIELGKKIGFDGTKILVPYQNLEKHAEGHYEDVTEFAYETISNNPETDLWNYDIPCDIMLIRSSLKGVVLAYPVADCPVMMALAGDTLALAHCGASMIDRLLPVKVLEVLEKETGIDKRNMSVRFGPSASSDTYIYETYPTWATNKSIWNTSIKEKDDGFHIDMKNAIKIQLMEYNIFDYKLDDRDTITDRKFYSNYAANHGDTSKDGRFLVGTYFEDTKVLRKILTR